MTSRRILAPLLGFCAVVMTVLSILVPGLQPIVLALTIVAVVAAITRLRFLALVVSAMWATSLVHLLKRAIFLVADYPSWAYYGVQAIPSVLLILALAVGMRRRRAWPASTYALAVFALLTVSETIIAPSLTALARFSAIHDHLVPMVGFLVGVLVAATHHERTVLRTLLWISCVSVPYGVFQFVVGPTTLDTRWAQATASYSIEAQKVLASIQHTSGADWRAYSFYADPLTWGLLLMAGLAATAALRSRDSRRVDYKLAIATLLIGLFVSLTRTPWIGVISMIAFAALIRFRVLRRRGAMMFALTALFGVVIVGGTYLYNNVFPSLRTGSSNVALNRYLTLGTAEARIGAVSKLAEAAREQPALGKGYAYTYYYADRLGAQSGAIGDVGGHDFLVDTTVATGVPGSLTLLAFLALVIGEGLAAYRRGVDRRVALWLTAFAAGSIVTGFLNASNFLNTYFFILVGVLAALGSVAKPTAAPAKRDSSTSPLIASTPSFGHGTL